MCKLKWARPFRLAILITDAPAHGKNWAGDGVTDDHKNEDLSVALDQMIEKNIKFLGFEFNVKTKFMFDQIEKVSSLNMSSITKKKARVTCSIGLR